MNKYCLEQIKDPNRKWYVPYFHCPIKDQVNSNGIALLKGNKDIISNSTHQLPVSEIGDSSSEATSNKQVILFEHQFTTCNVPWHEKNPSCLFNVGGVCDIAWRECVMSKFRKVAKEEGALHLFYSWITVDEQSNKLCKSSNDLINPESNIFLKLHKQLCGKIP